MTTVHAQVHATYLNINIDTDDLPQYKTTEQ